MRLNRLRLSCVVVFVVPGEVLGLKLAAVVALEQPTRAELDGLAHHSEVACLFVLLEDLN